MTYGAMLAAFKKKHGALVKPKQGWGSLHPSLHLAYSISVKRSFYDVGTYVCKHGDHGGRPNPPCHPPAYAFDIRRRNWVGRWGWSWLYAKRYAQFLWDNHEALNIKYVIRGREVISRTTPYWHKLSGFDTSHDWHLHISGSGWPTDDV